MEHNKPTPEWLTLQFLNKCLHSKEKYANSNIVSFVTEPAVSPGNNFGSDLLRVKVNYTEDCNQDVEVLSLIVKSPLSSGQLFFDDFYSGEPKFYQEFLPEAYKLLNYKFAPESFTSPISSIVVLEDLKAQGYIMAERWNQLDFEHCHLYVNAAANFHAVSLAVRELNPELIRSMSNEKMFSNDLKSAISTKKMIRYALDYLADSITEVNKKCSDVVRSCSSTLWDMLVECHQPNEVFNTLNQGDPWTANMMFRRDNGGKLDSIKILDFQNLRFTSPANDIAFFIWSSANHTMRESRIDDICCIYLDSLNRCLTEMNCPESLSYKSFKEHLLRSSPLVLWTVAVCLPLMLNPSTTDLSPLYSKSEQEYTPEDNPFRQYYFESFTQTHLPRIVKQLQCTGVFDYLENKTK